MGQTGHKLPGELKSIQQIKDHMQRFSLGGHIVAILYVVCKIAPASDPFEEREGTQGGC